MSVLPRRGVCSRSSPREGVSVASAVALAVVTQEATDKDGNELRKNLAQRVAVVIRKPLTLQRLTRAGLPEPLTEPSYGAGQHRYGRFKRCDAGNYA